MGSATPGNLPDGSSGTDPALNIDALLASARSGAVDELGELLESYRNYLSILARTQINRRIRPRVSPSDVVQETMLEAFRDFNQFGGVTERQLMAWLRQILINNLFRFIEQHLNTGKRDARLEIPIGELTDGINRTAMSFGQFFQSPTSSPSVSASRREVGVIISDLLTQLPPQYREVVILRNLRGLSFDEIAAELERSSGAARMLWLRAIDRFRELCERSGLG